VCLFGSDPDPDWAKMLDKDPDPDPDSCQSGSTTLLVNPQKLLKRKPLQKQRF
jgi:hypothetical protein